MKIYIETKGKQYIHAGMCIPHISSNSEFIEMKKEVNGGRARIVQENSLEAQAILNPPTPNDYINEYNAVDEKRRHLYSRMCDPLIAEAQIKRLSGNKAEADIIEAQALAARAKIQAENPWPIADA